jgi:23S rRNA (pseudouridine1915-N3)-methyltransferase
MINEAGFAGGIRSSIAITRSAIKVRIRIIREGKPKDAHLRALQCDYVARIEHFVKIRIEESAGIAEASSSASKARANRSGGRSGGVTPPVQRLLESLSESYKVALDPQGREWTSEEFAKWLNGRAVAGTRELAFVVGGDRGVPAAIRDKVDLKLGLSRMTLTHDWACTLLLEQIYRGFTILRGYPYAR